MTCVHSAHEFAEVKDLWSALACTHALTILACGSLAKEGAFETMISLKRGSHSTKLEKCGVFYLGDLVTCPRPRPPDTVDVSQFSPPQKVTVRISAPAQY